jgi:hypothetical protein
MRLDRDFQVPVYELQALPLPRSPSRSGAINLPGRLEQQGSQQELYTMVTIGRRLAKMAGNIELSETSRPFRARFQICTNLLRFPQTPVQCSLSDLGHARHASSC